VPGQREEGHRDELKEKGTPLHAASVVGDTVGDPFKDTSSVALNPVIKFTTLFGVLAVGMALELHEKHYDQLKYALSGGFLVSRCSSHGGRSTHANHRRIEQRIGRLAAEVAAQGRQQGRSHRPAS